ncbi:hypothetical protein BK673_11820 [Pseudomonas fluorescens]|uniref:Uncharacterized protein n=1 Tax=Pseudomonas fluorescens TaxID=294 RepID=A0A423P5P8_PSEFL|nr:hypothetical protein BK673_11820 [Pseudomonas fluorescens]
MEAICSTAGLILRSYMRHEYLHFVMRRGRVLKMNELAVLDDKKNMLSNKAWANKLSGAVENKVKCF